VAADAVSQICEFVTMNMHIFINLTHHLPLLSAFAPSLRGSKTDGEGWMGGAAVWSTAAAVPSCKFIDSNVRQMLCNTGDGCDHDGCSEG
jgi:hypothetical protein